MDKKVINKIIPKYWKNCKKVCEYSAAIVDLWGVVHDGKNPYPFVIECLQKLRNKGVKIIFLSNSPRRVLYVERQIQSIGVPKNCYDYLISSGELVFLTLQARSKNREKKKFFKIAPKGIDYLSEGMKDIEEKSIEKADYILLIGPYNDEKDKLNQYHDILNKAAILSIPIICANPDLFVMKGNKIALCAGSIAQEYLKYGGKVEFFGKPHPYAYKECFKFLDNYEKNSIVAIGDSPYTDIAGAHNQKIDSLFVAGGLHKKELIDNNKIDPDSVKNLFIKQNVALPKAVINTMVW
tara:strand:- start:20 stop:904 length:885 start_codon:yes stop_codon:yes gene_type:complete